MEQRWSRYKYHFRMKYYRIGVFLRNNNKFVRLNNGNGQKGTLEWVCKNIQDLTVPKSVSLDSTKQMTWKTRTAAPYRFFVFLHPPRSNSHLHSPSV